MRRNKNNLLKPCNVCVLIITITQYNTTHTNRNTAGNGQPHANLATNEAFILLRDVQSSVDFYLSLRSRAYLNSSRNYYFFVPARSRFTQFKSRVSTPNRIMKHILLATCCLFVAVLHCCKLTERIVLMSRKNYY